MKLKKLTGNILIATVSVLALVACKDNASARASGTKAESIPATTPAPSTPNEELSYSLGNIIGQRIKSDFENIDHAQVNQGINDALAGKKPALSKEKMQSLIEKSQQEQMKKAQQKMKDEARANLKKSEDFLKGNAKKPGVKVTASGLQYMDITDKLSSKEKEGLLSYLKEKPVMDMKAIPDNSSTVTVSYIGTYTGKDGKTHVFDASSKRKEPAKFSVSQVIKGWQEGLKLMHQGQTLKLFIPPKLAYGESGIPGVIPPNTMLTFKVTLLKVDNGSSKKTTPAPEKKTEKKAEKKADKPHHLVDEKKSTEEKHPEEHKK